MRVRCGAYVALVAVGVGLVASPCYAARRELSPAAREWKDELEKARRAAEAHPEGPELWKALATACLQVLRPDVFSGMTNREWKRLKPGPFEGAEEAVAKAKALAPEDPEVHLMQAWLLAANYDDDDQVPEHLEQGLVEAREAADRMRDDYFYQKAYADYRFMAASHMAGWRKRIGPAWGHDKPRRKRRARSAVPEPDDEDVAARRRELQDVAAEYEALIKQWPHEAELHLGIARVYGPGQGWPSPTQLMGSRMFSTDEWKAELRAAAHLDQTNAFPLLELAAQEAWDLASLGASSWAAFRSIQSQRALSVQTDPPADAETQAALLRVVLPLLREAAKCKRYEPYQPSYPKGWGPLCEATIGHLEGIFGGSAYRTIAWSLSGEAQRLQARGEIDEAADLCWLGIAMGRLLSTSPEIIEALTGPTIRMMCAQRLGEVARAAGDDGLAEKAEREMATAEAALEDISRKYRRGAAKKG